MIIKEINVINFGKFHQKSISLKPGMNIIYGENEAGKTTLHTFIRGMLFGIEKQRGKAGAKDLYRKYEPWENPSCYQGMMRIENHGTTYRIERIFQKETKSFQIINEDEGRELSREEIELLFAGLNESCYYNTVSISQLGSVTDRELEVILKNYAANIGSAKTMEINIKAAYADLDASEKKMIAENRTKEEPLILKSIQNAKEQLDTSKREQQLLIASIEQKKEREQKVLDQVKELSALDAKRLEELAKRNQRKEHLYQEIIRLTSELERSNLVFDQAKTHRTQLENKLKEVGIDSPETLNTLSEKVMHRTTLPTAFLLLMMSCIGTAVGLVIGRRDFSMFPNEGNKPGLFLIGTGVFLICLIIKYFYNKRDKNNKLERIKELRKMMERLDTANNEAIYMMRQIERKKESLAHIRTLLEEEEKTGLSEKDYSPELKQLEEEQGSLHDDIAKTQWILEQRREKDIETRKRIEDLQHRMDSIATAKLEIEAIRYAKATIERIATDIRNSFGKRLNERASYYMKQITNGKYDQIIIDDKLDITINGKKHLLSTFKLSKGTTEQVYMALRLAAADIIFEKDKKPILLDDAFAMYDNRRMGNTMKFLAENMEQVIIFSCHTREKLMADKLGVEYHLTRL